MRFFTSIIFLLTISFAGFAQKAAGKVWKKSEALTQAIFGVKDGDMLNKIISDKVSYGHSGGNVEDKTTMIKNAVANTASYKNLVIEKVSVDVAKKTAVVRHLLRATTVDKGTESPLNLHILLVWNKEGGDWKLLARQAVKINPK